MFPLLLSIIYFFVCGKYMFNLAVMYLVCSLSILLHVLTDLKNLISADCILS